MSVKPLNPVLYQNLLKRFGSVLIANEGAEFVGVPFRDPISQRTVYRTDTHGEYYRVCCPFCHDTRHRLWVNYRYGVWDPVARTNNRHKVVCFNEDCLEHPARRQQFEYWAYAGIFGRQRVVHLERGSRDVGTLQRVEPPGRLAPVHELPSSHSAVLYLESRGFDVAELGQQYQVAYCEEASPRYPAAGGRIIVPIFMHGELVGWQGRYVGDLDWKQAGVPKYYNLPGMRKQLMLYNYDTARHYPQLVVAVEGITDAWRVGPQCVSTLGHSLHSRQTRLLHSTWGSGMLVLLYDPDAWEKTEGLVSDLAGKFAHGVVPVRLPEGTDPAGFDRDVLWGMIVAAAAEHGTPLRQGDAECSQ